MVSCFIPARAGSKRIVNKNISKIGDISLIEWACKNSLKSGLIDKVVFSSDSEEYLEMASKVSNRIILHKRSENLSSDKSTDQELVTHLLEKNYLNEGLIVHIRPTSPFISSKALDNAIKILNLNDDYSSLKSVSKSSICIDKLWLESINYIDKEKSNNLINLTHPRNNNELSGFPTQSLPQSWEQTNSIDIYKSEIIRNGNLWGDNPAFFKYGSLLLDVDNEFDLSLIKKLYMYCLSLKKNAMSPKDSTLLLLDDYIGKDKLEKAVGIILESLSDESH